MVEGGFSAHCSGRRECLFRLRLRKVSQMQGGGLRVCEVSDAGAVMEEC